MTATSDCPLRRSRAATLIPALPPPMMTIRCRLFATIAALLTHLSGHQILSGRGMDHKTRRNFP
jgi:hypothetical protein